MTTILSFVRLSTQSGVFTDIRRNGRRTWPCVGRNGRFHLAVRGLWSQATHFERLAMARNILFSSELLKAFDLRNNELG